MKIIPRNIRRNSFWNNRKSVATVLSVSLMMALVLVCGIAVFAAEVSESNSSECLMVQLPSFSVDAQPEEIVVSGNNAYMVHLKVDGANYAYAYNKEDDSTVQDLLTRTQVQLEGDDEVNHDLSSQLEEDMTVEVGRVTYEEVTKQESIPYNTETLLITYTFSYPANDKYGPRLKNTQGVPGVREVKSRVKLVDGVAVESTVISSQVVTQPQDALVYLDATYLLDLGDGPPASYIKKMACEFTAYSYNEEGPSLTATGAYTKVGYVAVDKTVIPLHSYMYIVMDNGFVYGYAYAKDTGGAIKGNIIDIFLPSEIDCSYFGRRMGTVYIISYGS